MCHPNNKKILTPGIFIIMGGGTSLIIWGEAITKINTSTNIITIRIYGGALQQFLIQDAKIVWRGPGEEGGDYTLKRVQH